MSQGRPQHKPAEISLEPTEGWHCSHLYYEFDRGVLAAMTAEEIEQGRSDLLAALDPAGEKASTRLQTSVVSGNKADFGLMLMDPSPLKIDSVHQNLLSGGRNRFSVRGG